MGDLISRQALLEEYDRLHVGEPGRARKMIEDAPSVTITGHTNALKVTNCNDNDLVSRQTVIETMTRTPGIGNRVIDKIKALPVAGLIRCNACEHGVPSGRGDTYLCVISPEERSEHKWDFWCAYAERKKRWMT